MFISLAPGKLLFFFLLFLNLLHCRLAVCSAQQWLIQCFGLITGITLTQQRQRRRRYEEALFLSCLNLTLRAKVRTGWIEDESVIIRGGGGLLRTASNWRASRNEHSFPQFWRENKKVIFLGRRRRQVVAHWVIVPGDATWRRDVISCVIMPLFVTSLVHRNRSMSLDIIKGP